MNKILMTAIVFGVLGITAGGASAKNDSTNWFTGKDRPLQAAMDADDVAMMDAALANGATVNATGIGGVTPLEYAVGHFAKQCYADLLRRRANPNQRDIEGDNAVTLAARAYNKDPDYLTLAIKAGGDPNTRGGDNDPIIVDAEYNLKEIRTLHDLGADINIRTRTGRPMIIDKALAEDWDVVWLLLQLGAHYNYPQEVTTLPECFKGPKVTPPDSRLYKDKAASWKFLTAHGMKLPPL